MGQLAQQIRAKYPGAYDDLDDATLEAQVIAQYPQYADLAEPKEAEQPWDLTGPVKPAMIGMAKGAAQGAIAAGRLIHKIPGVSEGVDALYNLFGVKVDSGHDFGERNLSDEIAGPGMSAEERLGADYKNTTERVGGAIEQGLEMAVSGGAARTAAGKVISRGPRILPNLIADAATGATAAAAHGEDPKMGAAMNALVPVGAAIAGRAATGAKNTAVRLVRAAIKPNISEVKTWSGASRMGFDKAANRVAQFIINNRIATPEKAQAIVDDALAEVSALVGNQPTAAPQLAERYLKIIERSAAKQGLGADDVATIRTAAKGLVEGPMGEQVATSLKLTNPGGKLAIVPGAPVRALRRSVPADEALESARRSGQWSTRRAWGEQKGAATEAEKAVERGQRDAVKVAVPATRPHFAKASEAIKARDLLERADFRQGNRDVFGIPGQVVAAGEIMHGNVPVMGIAANLLRSGQLRAGFMADSLANAIRSNDAKTVTEILARLGVALGDQ